MSVEIDINLQKYLLVYIYMEKVKVDVILDATREWKIHWPHWTVSHFLTPQSPHRAHECGKRRITTMRLSMVYLLHLPICYRGSQFRSSNASIDSYHFSVNGYLAIQTCYHWFESLWFSEFSWVMKVMRVLKVYTQNIVIPYIYLRSAIWPLNIFFAYKYMQKYEMSRPKYC